MKKYILTFVVILSATLAYSQPNNEDAITIRTVHKVKQLTDYINYMADKNLPIEDRLKYRQAALNLFIGQGEAYIVNGSPRGVYMKITSKYRKKPVVRLMKDYFTGLVHQRYNRINIVSVEVVNDIKISELKKVGEKEYECTCTVSAFYGFHDGKPIYKKVPHKRVTCRIIEEETIQISSSGQTNKKVEYAVGLGDVEAIEVY